VATGSFQPGIGGVGINPLVNTQFQYIDVGVNLDITPNVLAEKEVSMKVKVEISAVTGYVGIGGINQPVIGQRVVDQEIRLREGEMNILGGIIENQVQDTISGLPGLSQVPLLKYLFSSTTKTVSENEILIILTPHLVRVPEISALNFQSIDVGTQTNPQVKTRQAVTAPALPPGTVVGGPAGGGAATPGTPAPGAPSTPPPATPQTTPAAPAPTPPGIPPFGAPPMTQPPIPTVQPTMPPGEEEAARRQPPALRFDAGQYTQALGDRFRVQVIVDNVQDVLSVPLQLQYDPKEIKLVDIIQGDLLGRDGQVVSLVQRVDDQAGTASVALNRPPASPGVSGSGLLATLSFQAIGKGDGVLNLQRSVARTSTGESLQMRGTQARIIVR
jgi:general secretion pathway protein D